MSFNYNLENFKEAKPVNTFVKMALAGPNNSGKTVSALRLAAGMGGETCVIDSENKRALKYASSFKFRHFDLQPPFSSENYQAAIEAAVKVGFNNVIVDSTSHEHEGPGGMLEQVESYLDRKTANIENEQEREKKRESLKMSAFIGPKAARNRLIQFGIQRINANVLLCFRAKKKMVMKKEKWVSADGKKSGEKTVVKDAGLQPIGGDEFWYEMDIVAMMQESSRGKPSWEEQASRINDMQGDLTSYLKSVEQFDETCGRRLVEFNRPVQIVGIAGKFFIETSKAKGELGSTGEWKEQAIRIIDKLTAREHFDAFTKLNNPHILAVKEVDPDAADDVLEHLSKRQIDITQTP